MRKYLAANCVYLGFGVVFLALLPYAQTPLGVSVCVVVTTVCATGLVLGLVEGRKPIAAQTRSPRER